MASDSTTTTISNTALAWLGIAKRLTAYDTDTSIEALQCRLHYDEVRQSLLRSFPWPFARERKTLSAEQTGPPFGPNYKFRLPNDYLSFYEDENEDDSVHLAYRGTREGKYLLADDNSIELVYIKDVTDPADFDPLFLDCLCLSLAIKLSYPLAGTAGITQKQREDLKKELKNLMNTAKNAARMEVDRSGRSGWNRAKFTTGTTTIGR